MTFSSKKGMFSSSFDSAHVKFTLIDKTFIKTFWNQKTCKSLQNELNLQNKESI